MNLEATRYLRQQSLLSVPQWSSGAEMALTHLAHLKRIKPWLVPRSGFLTEFADLSRMRAIRNVAPDSDSAAASTTNLCSSSETSA